MDKNKIVVVLGTPHRQREPGKMSPDKELRECVYGREIAADLKPMLEAYGLTCFIDYEPLDLPKDMQTPDVTRERQRELELRVSIVNNICRQHSDKECIYVTIHNDASGSDGKWHDPNGWSARVGTKASAKSKRLAECLADAAASNGLRVRQPTGKQRYWPQKLYVLNNTSCPAVLTENLFMDNVDDKSLLVSNAGRHIIARVHLEGILKYIEQL
jgi:N-acetylmuramoyl-L-alanine amidase